MSCHLPLMHLLCLPGTSPRLDQAALVLHSEQGKVRPGQQEALGANREGAKVGTQKTRGFSRPVLLPEPRAWRRARRGALPWAASKVAGVG